VERSELEMAMREHGVESVHEVTLASSKPPVVHTRKHIRQFRKP
jgi:hypothetical protein